MFINCTQYRMCHCRVYDTRV